MTPKGPEINSEGIEQLMHALQQEFDKHPIFVPIQANMPMSTKISKYTNIDKHVFICYAREDSDRVDLLQQSLEEAGIPVWRDTGSLWPGEDWRVEIRRAIADDAIAFIACFSKMSVGRDKRYQNEELLLAIDQLRQRRPGSSWFIPVRFDECTIPDHDLGGGRTLASIHTADLFGDHVAGGTTRLVTAILRILGQDQSKLGPADLARYGGAAGSPEITDQSLPGAYFTEYVRKIASDEELRAIATAGQGFIIDPFYRRWHFSACPHVRKMTTGQPKWFARSRAALDGYSQQRLRNYPDAKPILGCKTCCGSEEHLHDAN